MGELGVEVGVDSVAGPRLHLHAELVGQPAVVRVVPVPATDLGREKGTCHTLSEVTRVSMSISSSAT